jgi:hypothetical protein
VPSGLFDWLGKEKKPLIKHKVQNYFEFIEEPADACKQIVLYLINI